MIKLVTQFDNSKTRVSIATPSCACSCCCCCCVATFLTTGILTVRSISRGYDRLPLEEKKQRGPRKIFELVVGFFLAPAALFIAIFLWLNVFGIASGYFLTLTGLLYSSYAHYILIGIGFSTPILLHFFGLNILRPITKTSRKKLILFAVVTWVCFVVELILWLTGVFEADFSTISL